MLSRLSAGAFKKGASLGTSRTSSFLLGVRSASVCFSLLLFWPAVLTVSAMFNRSDLRLPMPRLRLPLRLAYYFFSLYCTPQLSKVDFKVSRYPRVCFSFHCRHNRMVHSSLWQPSLHRRGACQSSQRRRSSSSCLPLVSQRHSRHLRSRQV